MIPVPTPTLLPIDPVSIPLNIPEGMNLWYFAPYAVQAWNTSNRDNVLTIYQVAFLLMIIGVGSLILATVVKRLSTDDA